MYIYNHQLEDLGNCLSAEPMIVRPFESIRLGQAPPDQFQYIEATASAPVKNRRVTIKFETHGAMEPKKREQFIKRFINPMLKTKLGRDLLAALNKDSHVVSIAWGNGEFGFNGTVARDRKQAVGGSGSDAVIFMDQQAQDLKTLPTIRENPDVGLFHELLHARHMQQGTSTDDEKESEYRVIGIGKYSGNKGTENDYRDARGLPPRCCWDREAL